jgi:hypothetical protein
VFISKIPRSTSPAKTFADGEDSTGTNAVLLFACCVFSDRTNVMYREVAYVPALINIDIKKNTITTAARYENDKNHFRGNGGMTARIMSVRCRIVFHHGGGITSYGRSFAGRCTPGLLQRKNCLRLAM